MKKPGRVSTTGFFPAPKGRDLQFSGENYFALATIDSNGL